MNAVEIADAVYDLFQKDFDPAEFPFAFLEAFGNKETTLKRLRKGDSNASDVAGGVLQRNHIHIAVCAPGNVADTLTALRNSPKTLTNKVKFLLATDGEWLEAEELVSGEPLATRYADLPAHFAFFLPLAGISTVAEIKDNPIDIRATGRLNKLYVELLRENPEWATEARRPDMNHFMARLIFCFFAEDTGIFNDKGLFTSTLARMTVSDGSDTAQVVGRLFEAMNTNGIAARKSANLPAWTDPFPYVNGGLFSGSTEVPQFTRIARSYLLRAGELNWREINPDIFGSMIQAVADEGERSNLGMHYTSVPNILKVLNPLFLDDLRTQLETAGDNPRMLLNLRKRLSRIRVFDPACGSGNFLVIAYKEMRKIEAEINRRRDEAAIPSEIPLRNFCGIELRDFAAEIARLALIIADYQCEVLYRGEKLALAEFLPLNKMNWIVCGNALRLDWLQICPPTGTEVRVAGTDLFSTPLDQAEIDFTNDGGETYVCGNPPYKGQSEQTDEQKNDLASIFSASGIAWKNLDYVSGWFYKYCHYQKTGHTRAAFVSTNSICQGQHVPTLWPYIFSSGVEIHFAWTSFKWKNLASKNAGVTVVIIGLRPTTAASPILLFSDGANEQQSKRQVSFVGPYLIPDTKVIVEPSRVPLNGLAPMDYGSKPADGGGLIIKLVDYLALSDLIAKGFTKLYLGSDEYIDGRSRYCLWVPDESVGEARLSPFVRDREAQVRTFRAKSKKSQTREFASFPLRFSEIRHSETNLALPLIVPIHTGEDREYLPVGALAHGAVVSNAAFALYDAPLWSMAFIASRLHLIWIGTVCGKLETRYRYSNTLGWNTFPVPSLTESNKAELTRCAEDILLAREAHFPKTIADLYAPEAMPDDLRRAHEHNDETLERIYIGRRFKNDTERLEKLFEMYTKMTKAQPAPRKAKAKR